MRRVVIESPYGKRVDGTVATPEEIGTNLTYLRECMADCFKRGEAPYASHAIYTQPGVLDDKDPEQRKLGMEAGFEWGDAGAEATVVYTDRGVTPGMIAGINRALTKNRPIEYRELGPTIGYTAVCSSLDSVAIGYTATASSEDGEA